MDLSTSSGGAESVTARDLLHLYLDLRGMVPDLQEWSEDSLSSNPPRLVRLKQLKALFRAFEIPWNPSDFREGSFIEPEDPRHVPLLKRVASEVSEAPTLTLGSLGNQLPRLFSILLDYREDVDRALSFSDGFIEASGLSLLCLQEGGAAQSSHRTACSGCRRHSGRTHQPGENRVYAQ